MSNLSILSHNIRLNDGLYSLNDLHKASGGEKRHEPNRFIRLEQTKELIAEIEKCPDMGILPVKKTQGRNGGTWVCKELVYAYAMWISAKFHLHVIRAFDAISNQSEIENAGKDLEMNDPIEAVHREDRLLGIIETMVSREPQTQQAPALPAPRDLSSMIAAMNYDGIMIIVPWDQVETRTPELARIPQVQAWMRQH